MILAKVVSSPTLSLIHIFFLLSNCQIINKFTGINNVFTLKFYNWNWLLDVAVSYTHLDVYKRQVLVCVAIESVSVYFVATISGIFIGIGMIILLFTNIFRTIRKKMCIRDRFLSLHSYLFSNSSVIIFAITLNIIKAVTLCNGKPSMKLIYMNS